MAIRRQLIEQIKFVLKSDSSVDHNNSDYKKYVDDGYNLEHLKQKGDDAWTVFVLAPLSRRQKTALKNAVNGRQEKEFAFQFSVREISNFYFITPSGHKKELGEIKRADFGTAGWMVTDEFMDEIDLSELELIEIYDAIERISGLSDPL